MSTERLAATKGTLQKAREQLGFIQKGKEVLTMKRDQLAGELNKLLGELGRRRQIERQIAQAFADVKYVYSVFGYDAFASAANAADLIEVQALPVSAVGVVMPEVKITKKPIPNQVPLAGAMKASAELGRALEKAIELGVLEAKVERLATELMNTNRKVNALEKVVIPRYKSTIRYIEEKLNEQALQEFFVTKKIRDISRGTATKRS